MATRMSDSPVRTKPLSRAGQAIIGALRANTDPDGWMSQGGLSKASGVPGATLSRTMPVLANRGLVERDDRAGGGRGRPSNVWRLCRPQALAGGVVLDAMGLHAGVVDMDGRVVEHWSGRATSLLSGTVPKDGARTLQRWAEEGLDPERFVSVTIAVPEAVAEARADELERALASQGVPGRIVPLGAVVADCPLTLDAGEPAELVVGAWVGREVDARVVRRGGPVVGSALDPLAGYAPDGVSHAFSLIDRGGLTPPVDPMNWDEAVFAREGYKAWIEQVGRWLAEAGVKGAAPRIAQEVWISGPLSPRMLDDLTASAEAALEAGVDLPVTPEFRSLDLDGGWGLVAALAGLARLGAKR